MTITWFATFSSDAASAQVSQTELKDVYEIIAPTRGLTTGLIYTPWPVDDLQFDDGPPPNLQLQLYFDDIQSLEAAIGDTGGLNALNDPELLPSLVGAKVTEQAMLSRSFPVLTPPDPTSTFCTFLVHYPGPAKNLNLWLSHYIAHHTPIMQRFPGLRGLEVCSRLDWCSSLGWSRDTHMQRNKVVFDDAHALKTALSSPVLQELRADSANSPAYAGGNAHFPMRTWQIEPRQKPSSR